MSTYKRLLVILHMSAYILELFDCQSLRHEDILAEFAQDMTRVRVADRGIIEVTLAQLETLMALWYSQHFSYFNLIIYLNPL